MRFEQLINEATTTLNGAITSGATSITVDDGSVYPATGDWRIIIDEELLLVTARASNVLTVVRGVESTTAASHVDGANVDAVITQGGLDQYVKDFVDPLAFDRLPNRLLDKGGNILTTSDFTVLNNASGSEIDDANGSITLLMEAGAAPDARVLYKAAPTAPYTVTAHVLSGIGSNATAENANVLGFRENSSGKLSFISFHYANSTFTQYLDDPTTAGPANSSSQNVPHRADYWLRIKDDGTNLVYSISADGYNFWQQHTELRAFHFNSGPDQIWWGGDNQGVNGEMIHLLSWSEQ